jgi:hypothetical protein
MLYDGLGYFFALTAVNVLNLVLYRAKEDLRVRFSYLFPLAKC